MYMYSDAAQKLVFMRVSYQSHTKGSPKGVFLLLLLRARVTWETLLCETAVCVLAKAVLIGKSERERKKRTMTLPKKR